MYKDFYLFFLIWYIYIWLFDYRENFLYVDKLLSFYFVSFCWVYVNGSCSKLYELLLMKLIWMINIVLDVYNIYILVYIDFNRKYELDYICKVVIENYEYELFYFLVIIKNYWRFNINNL